MDRNNHIVRHIVKGFYPDMSKEKLIELGFPYEMIGAILTYQDAKKEMEREVARIMYRSNQGWQI